MKSKTIHQLLQFGYADSKTIRSILYCLLNLDDEPCILVDLNCGEGWLSELVDCCEYYGFDASEELIRLAKQRYPKIADNFTSVDVFRYTNGEVDVAVCLGLLHHHHDPLLGLSNLLKLWQPKIFYASFITSTTAIDDTESITVLPLEEVNTLPNLVGCASFRITDKLFWTIIELKQEAE